MCIVQLLLIIHLGSSVRSYQFIILIIIIVALGLSISHPLRLDAMTANTSACTTEIVLSPEVQKVDI